MSSGRFKLSRLFKFLPEGPEYVAGTLCNAGFLAVRSVGQTLVMINVDHIVFNTDRSRRTRLDTHFARDAADLADVPHRLSRILCAAGNPDASLQGHQLNNLLGTGAYTGSAADTLFHIDNGKLLLHGNGAKGAGSGTVAQSDAGVCAVLRTTKGDTCTCAGIETKIGILLFDLPFDTGTSDLGNHIFDTADRFSRNFGNCRSHFRLAGKAEIRWNVRVVDNRFGICFATCKAAAASLSPRQNFQDLFYLGIALHGELLSGQRQADAEQQTDAAEERDASNCQFNQYRIHDIPQFISVNFKKSPFRKSP